MVCTGEWQDPAIREFVLGHRPGGGQPKRQRRTAGLNSGRLPLTSKSINNKCTDNVQGQVQVWQINLPEPPIPYQDMEHSVSLRISSGPSLPMDSTWSQGLKHPNLPSHLLCSQGWLQTDFYRQSLEGSSRVHTGRTKAQVSQQEAASGWVSPFVAKYHCTVHKCLFLYLPIGGHWGHVCY